MRSAVIVLTLAFAMLRSAEASALQAKTAVKTDSLPPISYVCPMTGDEEVIEDKPGKCPKCGMTLVPIRLVSVWTCAQQPGLVTKDQPGKCPVDGQPLVQMTMAETWTCAGSTTESPTPGTCKDGSPMKPQFKLRAHGNHNPQHGGQFFMAPDNWHHLEGTYPQAGVFRMYLYDDFTKPLPAAQQREVSAQVVVAGKPYPLTIAPNGRYLEAKVGTALPAAMQAKVTFKPGGQSNVFDFTFDKYSKEASAAATTTAAKPPAATVPSTTASAPARTPATPAPTAPPPAPAATPVPSGVDPALIPLPIPEAVPDMLDQLRTRTEQIGALIDKGLFADVYVPAFQAKDVALALEPHQRELPTDKQRITEPAIAKLVRAAYLLDAFGDLGNKQQIAAAYAEFAAASKDILAAFPQSAR
jgi:heavy metal-binding protein